MRAYSLKQKIILLCITLVLACTLASMASFGWISSRYQASQVETEMRNAEQVVREYLEARASLLYTAASVLTADFGFKQAVASRDQATITSALENHGTRIDADLMLIIGLDGTPIAQSGDYDLDSLLASKPQNTDQRRVGFLNSGNQSYEIITLPVRAPRTIAYCILGFETDSSALERLKELTGMDISLQLPSGAISNSTLDLGIAETGTPNTDREETGETYQAALTSAMFEHRSFTIDAGKATALTFILSKDLSLSQQKFNRMLLSTLALTAFAAMASVMAAVRLGRSLTNPLQHLVARTRSFAKGKYGQELYPTGATAELRELANAFNDMGNEIAVREARIEHQATHDSLTDLLNRTAIEQSIAAQLEKHESFSIVAIHIEEFQTINDQFGSDAADRCLTAVASRLRDFVSEFDFLAARMDSSRFVIQCDHTDKVAAESFAGDLIEALSEPVALGEVGRGLKLRGGVVLAPEHGDHTDALFRRVFMALNAAAENKAPVSTYEQGIDEKYLLRLALLEELHNAIREDDGQLFMVYQPKLFLASRHVNKAEALIRWQHPSRGFIPPDEFIALAEQSDLIVDLTHLVIRKVVQQVSLWSAKGLDIQTSINISAQDLVHPKFGEVIRENIQRCAVPPSLINLELTERDLMQNEERAMEVAHELRTFGFTISVDDYGIGQSSLAKLKSLPIDELKIDKSFVLNLDQSPADQFIVESTIKLGHKLGKKVIAEGVETKESLELLAQYQCNYAQGYFISRPIKADDMYQWCMNYNNRKQTA